MTYFELLKTNQNFYENIKYFDKTHQYIAKAVL